MLWKAREKIRKMRGIEESVLMLGRLQCQMYIMQDEARRLS